LQAGDIKLSEDDLAEVNKIVDTHEIKGDRYHGNDEQAHLWG
jgi:pyridoxine 4-dehydrogenase